MTDCLVILYLEAWRQSLIAIFFLYLWWARFFSTCSPDLVYLGPYSRKASDTYTFFWLSKHKQARLIKVQVLREAVSLKQNKNKKNQQNAFTKNKIAGQTKRTQKEITICTILFDFWAFQPCIYNFEICKGIWPIEAQL